MIYTLTFNPSIDYLIGLDEDIAVGGMNRSDDTRYLVGGKGLNVSQILNNLGVSNTALGFVAGFVGKQITQGLTKCGVASDFIELENGNSRINVKIHTSVDTEINAKGPDIDEMALAKMCKRISCVKKDDYLIISGSPAGNMTETDLCRIIEASGTKNLICDLSGKWLKEVLKYEPFLIKPNHMELAEAVGYETNPKDGKAITEAARRLIGQGARNVLVSCADIGAYLVRDNGEVMFEKAPKGTAVNAVGAGDSLLAGFVAGLLGKEGRYDYALRLAVAAGSATAFSTDLATKEEIYKLL